MRPLTYFRNRLLMARLDMTEYDVDVLLIMDGGKVVLV